MRSVESERHIPVQEEPFLRTRKGKAAVLYLSALMVLSAAGVTEATKTRPQVEDPFADYDPNATMIVISMPMEERPIPYKPKSYEDVVSVKSIEHVLPEGIEKMLKEDNLTKKGK